jgi:hypothetical protein
VRLVEQPYVSQSAMEELTPATGYLRRPGIDGRRPRVDPVRVGKPSLVGRTGQPVPPVQTVPRTGRGEAGWDGGTEVVASQAAVPIPPLPLAEPEAQQDEDLARVLGRLEQEGEWVEGCHLWPASGCNAEGYAKTSVQGQRVTVHKWLWECARGEVPRGWSLEHTCHTAAKARGECRGGRTCRHRRCCELAHLVPMPIGEHSSRTEHRRGNA